MSREEEARKAIGKPPSNPHFAITPAKPKGTLADFEAGNLPPPKAPEEPVAEKVRRRRPNPSRTTAGVASVEEAIERALNKSGAQPAPPHEIVLGDLYARKREIEAAIRALEGLYR